jgi:hypothetical protein
MVPSVYLNDTNPSLTVVAVPDRTKGPISKVQMGWNRYSRYRIETVEPYTLCGGTSYAPCKGLGEGVQQDFSDRVGVQGQVVRDGFLYH